MKRSFVYVFSFGLLFSCSHIGPGKGPEGVLRDFFDAISTGDCERAKNMTANGNAVDLVQAHINSSCETYPREILNITCELDGDNADCECEERYLPDPELDMTTYWSLTRQDNEWKVASFDVEAEFSNHIKEENGGTRISFCAEAGNRLLSKSLPELTVRHYEQALANGSCHLAKSYTTGRATDDAQGYIDAGCSPYMLDIMSIDCKTDNDEYSKCDCVRRIPGIDGKGHKVFIDYFLKKMDGEWKISGMTWDW